MLTWPVATVGWVTSIVQQAEASQKRINEFLKEKSKISNKCNKKYNIEGKVEFNNITLVYPETKIIALNKLSFEINVGKSLGIIGNVGSGKSSIAELILRNYDPDIGEVRIDGKNIKSHNLNILRQNIGYVPQNTVILNGSLRENILFGASKINFNDKKILDVISKVELNHFLKKLTGN